MTRAYIRLDPGFDERKEAYPDGPYAALVATFCLAEHQAERGRFRSIEYLSRLLGRRGRHVRYLVDHGDVSVLDDGRAYVDGWDEWQEGDWKVAERVHRIRSRKRNDPTVTPTVASPDPSNGTPSDGSGGGVMSAGAAADDPADIYWQLTGRYPSGKLLSWIDEASEHFGGPAVIRGLVTAHRQDPNAATVMGRAQDLWRREARELDRKERDEEHRRLAEKRAQPRVEEPWKIEWRKAIHERYGDGNAA